MNEAEQIDQLIKVLQQVPVKSLLIIELANSIPVISGLFDQDVLRDKQVELNLAMQEAKMYGGATSQMVTVLSQIGEKEDS
jgi:hypothetical protein